MKAIFSTVLFFLGAAIIGGLIGFGNTGTIQGMCLGAGVGMIVPVAAFLFLFLSGSIEIR